MTPPPRPPAAGAAETAALAAAFALPLALWHTTFHAVPAAGGLWRGVSQAPGPGRIGLAVLAGIALAWRLRRLPPSGRRPLLALAAAGAPLLALAGAPSLLLVFQGPALAVTAAAALAAALAGAAPRLRPSAPGGTLLFAVGLAFLAALGARIPGPAGPQGDEPHYLAMAHSLLTDGDLDLADEFAGREYRGFFAGTLEAHTSPASPPGRIYAVHAPGLAVLMLPAYALGGYPAARLLIAALAALAGVLVHRLVRDVTGSEGRGVACWAALVFTPPLAFYALALYPETAAALATAVFLTTARRDPGPLAIAAAAAAAAALPWLHPKFLPLAAAGLGLTLVRRCPWPARALGAAAFAASVAGLLAFFHALYGRASLSAAYGPGFASDVSAARIPAGVAGILLDRQFGLFAVGPLLLLAVPGFVRLCRERLGDALRAAILGAASLLVGGSFSMWWGGACPPARFAVPALPALALGLAFALPRWPRAAAALGGAGLAIVAVAAEAPRALHNRGDGESGLLRVLAPALDLDGALPSFVLATGADALLALTLAAALALAWARGRRGLAAGALAYALVAAGVRPQPLLDRSLAALRLLEAWDEHDTRGLTGPVPFTSLRIPLDLRGAPWSVSGGEARVSRRIDLPPGRYRLEVQGWSEGLARGSRSARVEVSAGELVLDAAYLERDRPGLAFALPLPVGARRLGLGAVGVQGRGVVAAAWLVPEAVVPRSRRGGLRWPRQPRDDAYRAGAGPVRTTALDRVTPAAGGFALDGAAAAFVVEAPAGSTVAVHVRRAAPAAADALAWAGRRVALPPEADVYLRLEAGAAATLDGVALVSVELRAGGAWIAFSEQAR